HLRHDPAAEDRAVRIGVGGHGHDAKDGLLILGEGGGHRVGNSNGRLNSTPVSFSRLHNGWPYGGSMDRFARLAASFAIAVLCCGSHAAGPGAGGAPKAIALAQGPAPWTALARDEG